MKSDNQIRVLITTPDLDSLDVSGVANVTVSGLKNEEGLTVDASGASKIKIAASATFKVIGTTSAVRARSTPRTLPLLMPTLREATSNIIVNVTGRLILRCVLGASRVIYSGSPTSVRRTQAAEQRTAK